MERYSVITEKNPREILLLRGSGCKWRKCRFCDYHLDFSKDEAANYRLNESVLSKVTGKYGVLETINSGSFCDLDEKTIKCIMETCKSKKIHSLHIECHWRDRQTLQQIKQRFQKEGIRVTVKMGVETFDADFRDSVMCKGMEGASPQEIAEWADEVCLLFGITGQTLQTMERDIETGLQYFERVCVNIMNENSSKIQPDQKVIETFVRDIYPQYMGNDRVDILMENTDFGVGGKDD